MASLAKAAKSAKAKAEDLQAQIERLQAELHELLGSSELSAPARARRAPSARVSRPATKGQKLEAAADYGVSDQQLERFIEKLDDQAEKDAQKGRLTRYTGRIEDLFGD